MNDRAIALGEDEKMLRSPTSMASYLRTFPEFAGLSDEHARTLTLKITEEYRQYREAGSLPAKAARDALRALPQLQNAPEAHLNALVDGLFRNHRGNVKRASKQKYYRDSASAVANALGLLPEFTGLAGNAPDELHSLSRRLIAAVQRKSGDKDDILNRELEESGLRNISPGRAQEIALIVKHVCSAHEQTLRLPTPRSR